MMRSTLEENVRLFVGSAKTEVKTQPMNLLLNVETFLKV